MLPSLIRSLSLYPCSSSQTEAECFRQLIQEPRSPNLPELKVSEPNCNFPRSVSHMLKSHQRTVAPPRCSQWHLQSGQEAREERLFGLGLSSGFPLSLVEPANPSKQLLHLSVKQRCWLGSLQFCGAVTFKSGYSWQLEACSPITDTESWEIHSSHRLCS